jgi:hypothetical protein
MKRLLLVLIMLILSSWICSCQGTVKTMPGETSLQTNQTSQPSQPSQTSQSAVNGTSSETASNGSTTTGTTIKPRALVEWEPYDSIQKLVARSDEIIVGDVIREAPAVLIPEYKSGSKTIDSEFAPLTIKVVENYKGVLAPATLLIIYQNLSWYDDDQLIHGGELHLFFLHRSEEIIDGMVRCYLNSPDASFPKIVDNKLYVDDLSEIFYNGCPLDQARNAIFTVLGEK